MDDLDDFLAELDTSSSHGGSSAPARPAVELDFSATEADVAGAAEADNSVATIVSVSLEGIQCPFNSPEEVKLWKDSSSAYMTGSCRPGDDATEVLQEAIFDRAAHVKNWSESLEAVLSMPFGLPRATLLERLAQPHSIQVLGCLALLDPQAPLLCLATKKGPADTAAWGASSGFGQSPDIVYEDAAALLRLLLPLAPSAASPSLPAQACVAALRQAWAAAAAPVDTPPAGADKKASGTQSSRASLAPTQRHLTAQGSLQWWAFGAGHAASLLAAATDVLVPLLCSGQGRRWGLVTAPCTPSQPEQLLSALASALCKALACLCCLEENARESLHWYLASKPQHLGAADADRGASSCGAGSTVDLRVYGLVLAAVHPVWARVLPAVRVLPVPAASSSATQHAGYKSAAFDTKLGESLLELWGRPWHAGLLASVLLAPTAGSAEKAGAAPPLSSVSVAPRKSLSGSQPSKSPSGKPWAMDTLALKAMREGCAAEPEPRLRQPFQLPEESAFALAWRVVAWALRQGCVRIARPLTVRGEPWMWGEAPMRPQPLLPLPLPGTASGAGTATRLVAALLQAFEASEDASASEGATTVTRLRRLRAEFSAAAVEAAAALGAAATVPQLCDDELPLRVYITAQFNTTPYPVCLLLPDNRTLPADPAAALATAQARQAAAKPGAEEAEEDEEEEAGLDVSAFFSVVDSDASEGEASDDEEGEEGHSHRPAGLADEEGGGLGSAAGRASHQVTAALYVRRSDSDRDARVSARTARKAAVEAVLARLHPEALACMPGASELPQHGGLTDPLLHAALKQCPLGDASIAAQELAHSGPELVDLVAGDALVAAWAPLDYDRLPLISMVRMCDLPPSLQLQVLRTGVGVPSRFPQLAAPSCSCAALCRVSEDDEEREERKKAQEKEAAECPVHGLVPPTWLAAGDRRFLSGVGVYTHGAALATGGEAHTPRRGAEAREVALTHALAALCCYTYAVLTARDESKEDALTTSGRSSSRLKQLAAVSAAAASTKAAWLELAAARCPTQAATTPRAAAQQDHRATSAEDEVPASGRKRAGAAPGKDAAAPPATKRPRHAQEPVQLLLQPGALIEVILESQRSVRLLISIEPSAEGAAVAGKTALLRASDARVHSVSLDTCPFTGETKLVKHAECADNWALVSAAVVEGKATSSNSAKKPSRSGGKDALPPFAAFRASEGAEWQPLARVASAAGAPVFAPEPRGPTNWEEQPPPPAWPLWQSIEAAVSRMDTLAAAGAAAPAAGAKAEEGALFPSGHWCQRLEASCVAFAPEGGISGAWASAALTGSHLPPLAAWEALCAEVEDDAQAAGWAKDWDDIGEAPSPSASPAEQQAYASKAAARGTFPERPAAESVAAYNAYARRIGRLLHEFDAFHSCSEVFKKNLAESIAQYYTPPQPIAAPEGGSAAKRKGRK